MISFKRLNECKLNEVVQAWNEGFAGYFFDATMTVGMFLNRLVLEELSPTLSIVAYDSDRPVGILLNGIRHIQGRKIAWNGGTGVIEEYRGKGVSRELLDHALQLYHDENVQLASLEAISGNERAIRLYKGKGYEIVDHILYMNTDQTLPTLVDAGRADYAYLHSTPHDIKDQVALIPWQLQWENFRRDGETLLVHENGRLIAYALFKRTYHANGVNSGVVVAQVRVLEKREDQEQLLHFLLSKTLHPERSSYTRSMPVLASDRLLLPTLRALGFEETLSQVWMTRAL